MNRTMVASACKTAPHWRIRSYYDFATHTLLYGGVQLFESYALDPYIDRKTVYLPPALTIVAQLVLALACGLLGVALAAPLVATLVVLVTMLYVQDVLGRRDVKLASH